MNITSSLLGVWFHSCQLRGSETEQIVELASTSVPMHP